MADNKERIVDIDVAKEMRESFLEYSYSVIYSRALPDARDGLKPVQRRIVYQMGEMGLRPDRGHVKSARVTGEVMGKLHPHGDGAIYDALVRMSQSFSLRVPLIDGHGNFGSLDDGPAAARYTEARLTKAALLLNESLDEDVVDFEANYDAQLMEPAVLPAAFPNLLVNGASGIAVGMATNMAPHNLREVVSALRALISNPGISLDEIMEHIPGPDLPSGAVALIGDGLKEAYETGRGTFRMRAKIAIETVGPRRTGLVVTELPYLVGPERVIDKIRDAVGSKKLEGIHNVVDLTDRDNGLRLVIELKTGFDPNSVIEALYRLTPLEESFGINNVALVEGRPQQLPLKALLEVYLAHRIEVVTRRSKNRLEKRKSRLHLLDGLQIAVLNIDEVIEVIRTSDTADNARERLRTVFDLSDLQAEYILELRLRRLTRFSLIELEQEADQLRTEISELERLLNSEQLIRNQVSTELELVSENFGDSRRTQLIDSEGITVSRKPVQVSEIEDAPAVVVHTPTGLVYRSTGLSDGEIGRVIETTTRADVGFITSKGRAIRVHVSDLPTRTPGVSGALPDAAEYLGLQGERVVGLVPWASQAVYAVGTVRGVVKRFSGPLTDRDELEVIALKDLDEVIGLSEAEDDANLVFVSAEANLLIFSAISVRPQGFAAGGMAGINLGESRAVFFGVSAGNELLVTAANSSQALGATDPGSIKLTPLENYPSKGRATQGVRCQRLLKNEDQIYFAGLANSPHVFDLDGNQIDLPEIDPRRDGSGKPVDSYVAGCS
jgi:DNA gyrase subunit A